jgi:hypothetical protein
MIRAQVDITKTLTSLNGVEKRFAQNGRFAVLRTAKSLMRKIVDKTNEKAPGPPVKYYERTGRLMGGWAPGAAYVGISAPNASAEHGREGYAYLSPVGETPITFFAVNAVRYAKAVEDVGPW